MGRFFAILAVAISLFAGAVWFAVSQPKAPRGYSGLEFSTLTPAGAARTPLRNGGGATIIIVDPGSPAAKAGIKPGEVAAAIDGVGVTSARQASDRMRRIRAGEKMTLTLYDITKGEVHPDTVAITLETPPSPDITKKYSVLPPRTLAREFFFPPPMAANAAWSRRIARGPQIKPLALAGLGAGRCNGFAPERWVVAGHAPDDSMFHVMAQEGFAHAIYLRAPLKGRAPADFVRATLLSTFGAPAILTKAGPQPYGFTLLDFGNAKGGTGFVDYIVKGGQIQLWIAAVPGADVAWAKPLVGAVVLSLNCGAASKPRDPAMVATTVSTRCLEGSCEDSDFAAAYLKTLRLGYVHDKSGAVYLINPRKDNWINGSEGPGFYHQTGGANEKLEPVRTN